jgi:hypothetical protein
MAAKNLLKAIGLPVFLAMCFAQGVAQEKVSKAPQPSQDILSKGQQSRVLFDVSDGKSDGVFPEAFLEGSQISFAGTSKSTANEGKAEQQMEVDFSSVRLKADGESKSTPIRGLVEKEIVIAAPSAKRAQAREVIGFTSRGLESSLVEELKKWIREN